jgi:hypothetical protein
MTDDEQFEVFVTKMREGMGEALAAFMRYANVLYRDAIEENAQLRKRNEYLEQRVTELERPRAA